MRKALRLTELASLPLMWFALVGGALSVHRCLGRRSLSLTDHYYTPF